jgi:hypothetical protein
MITNITIARNAQKLVALTLAIAASLVFTSEATAQTGYFASAYRTAARPVPYAYPQQVRPAVAYAIPLVSNYLSFNGKYAAAPNHLPAPVQYAVNAGNQLQNKPYALGGGHRSVYDNAYDCSGSVSYTLIMAGLLNRPLSSSEFANYGAPGTGRFITIYVKAGEHVFMSICGLRFDTTGRRTGEGPRWRPIPRSIRGFTMRHPFGL